MIYFEHSNWKPTKMVPLQTFMRQIDREPEPEPDYFKLAKKKERLNFQLHRDDIKPGH